jgi:LEA14-like dessication related protein
MILSRKFAALLLFTFAFLPGCASLRHHDPLEVSVAGIDPLRGEQMELRLNVKLRVQNPNDVPVEFNGVSLKMRVQGKTFGTGVSDAAGTVPRFGETLIEVPVTISGLRALHNAIQIFRNGAPNRIDYEMTGKLATGSLNSTRFETKGDFDLPKDSQ